MSAQTYTEPIAVAAMRRGLCPECGKPANRHTADNRFWLPRICSLLPSGVTERIEWQQELDRQADQA